MSDDLDQYVQLDITRESLSLDADGFGTYAIMAYHTVFAENFREYANAAAVAADGFGVNSDVYMAVAKAKRQVPSIKTIIVGRLPAPPAHTKTLTVGTAVQGLRIQCKVKSPSTGDIIQIDRLIPAASSTTAEAAAVELLIEAVAGVASAQSGAVVTITPDTAGNAIHVFDCVNCSVEDTTADAGYDVALTALALEADFYFVGTDSASSANLTDVAVWAGSNKRLALLDMHNGSELTSGGTIGSAQMAATNERVAFLWSDASHEHNASGMVSMAASRVPGSYTLANKIIVGATAKRLTPTQKSYLKAHNVNYIDYPKKRSNLTPGIVSSGEDIGIIHGTDAFYSAMQEALFLLLATTEKLDYTNEDADLIRGKMNEVGNRFIASGLFKVGSFKVEIPDVSAQSDTDVGVGHFDLITFQAVYRGAIKTLGVRGNLSMRDFVTTAEAA